VALRFLPLAHCPRCGNLNLQRIARDYVSGAFAWLPRLVRVPAFRCDPCRHRFFSIRPHRKILPSREALPESQTASQTITR
jgi:hypothetical protein